MNNIQEAQLLRDNHSALVAQLNDLGFADVNDNTPLSELPDYIRWAGGLRDLRLAVIIKSTGAYSDYSLDEWTALSASAKAACLMLGIRIRAERLDFIIAKKDITSSTGSYDIHWAPYNLVNVHGLTDYGSVGSYKDVDGEANTNIILQYGAENNLYFEAAERARAYKAFTVADSGFDDTTIWSVPALGQLLLLEKYRPQINAAITAFFGPSYILADAWYWSSTECDDQNTWRVYLNRGSVVSYVKRNTCMVRAVAPVPSSAM